MLPSDALVLITLPTAGRICTTAKQYHMLQGRRRIARKNEERLCSCFGGSDGRGRGHGQPCLLSKSEVAGGGATAQAEAKAEFYSLVPAPEIAATAAMLLDAETGQVLFSMNPDERLAPASITKVMTMLIVMERVDEGKISLDDTVVVSREASMMGGSQVYLKEKEQASVEDLMAATAIRSANDASYALAEVVSGTADALSNS